ncbi:hypothetical protein [uncultured Spongiibacter sp.]|uniref:hypothetical protein n=1 Tax=uncultured Spongiibacter sp. TaxID=870896 RepID=UPI003390615B
MKSKYKIDRRLGVNLWGRPKSPSNNRDYPPGQHGQRRRKASPHRRLSTSGHTDQTDGTV